jgi:hypothetical protein
MRCCGIGTWARAAATVLIGLSCALAAPRAAARDVYVSTSGSNDNDGATVAAPVATLEHAVALAGSDECTIHLSAGTFDAEGLTIPSATERLTIVGERGDASADASAHTILLLHGPIAITGRPLALSNLILQAGAPTTQPTEKPAVDMVLQAVDAPEIKLSACLFRGSAATAVHLQKCQQWRVENCVFTNIYRCLLVEDSPNGQIVNNTIADMRLGNGTSSLTNGRIELREAATDHIVFFNNAFCPRDPDGKVLMIDGCGDDIRCDHNLWRGVFTHHYGNEQLSTWQNNFRTVAAWRRHTAKHWGEARDQHSRNEPLNYSTDADGVVRPSTVIAGEFAGAGEGIARYEEIDAPPTDFFGQARERADIGAFALSNARVAPQRVRAFAIDLPSAGRATVGIFDADGHQIRTLVSGRFLSAGKHTLQWDGIDNAGKMDARAFEPDAKFSFRAVLTPESDGVFDIAGAGIHWPAGSDAMGLASQPQENGEGMWCDAAGNLFRVAAYDEGGSAILSTDHAGHYRWRNWKHNGTLITGDDQFVYVVGCEKHEKNVVVLERFPNGGAEPQSWPNGRAFASLGPTDQITPTGVAVADGKLFLSDGAHDRLLVFSLGADRPEREIAVPRPAGLFARPDGSIVVCSRKLEGQPASSPGSSDGRGGIFVLAADGRVLHRYRGQLDDPVDVAAAPDGSVFVADGGIGAVQQALRCRLEPSFEIIDRLGARGGYDANDDPVVRPDRFLRINHLACSGSSLWVGQREPGYARNRLVRYDLQAGRAPTLGIEILSLEGQNGSTADPRDPTKVYSADLFRYDVNLGTGDWNWTRNFQHARVATIGEEVACSTAAVFYVGEQRFVGVTIRNSTTTTSRTAVIYRFDGEKLIPCAAIGGQFFGTSFDAKQFIADRSGKWVWLDANLDGRMQENEVKFVEGGSKDGKPFADCTWGTYIERNGAIVWPGENVHYLKPRGLDASGKVPVYDWSDAVTVAYQGFPERDEKYQARVDTDGSIFDLSTTRHDRMPQGYWGMGTVLTGLDPAGQKQFSVPLDLTAKGLAIDDQFVFVCSCFGPYINQYTKDGLLVRTFSWGRTGSQFGWFDYPTPINAVTDPGSGDSVLTTEEQWFGRVMVFRVPNNVKRLTGELPPP